MIRLKWILPLAIAAVFTLRIDFVARETQTRVPLHFVKGINGRAILANVDRMLKNHATNIELEVNVSTESTPPAAEPLSPADSEPTAPPAADPGEIEPQYPFPIPPPPPRPRPVTTDAPAGLTQINPKLGHLWNNTLMVFGATADGVGVGTAFAVKRFTQSSIFVATNFHVIAPFCRVPKEEVAGQARFDDLKYECKSLFVMHDVLINTKTNQTSTDGSQPWKSKVEALLMFDRKLDLAVFKVNLPESFELSITEIAIDYDLAKPLFMKENARLIPGKYPAGHEPTYSVPIPMDNLELYMVSYSVPISKDKKHLIKKSWQLGHSDGLRAFETDERLGLVSAIKHSIAIDPGSSGAPIALSDGRVIGINASLELNQFFAKSGCSEEKLESHVSYYAIPSVFLKPIVPNQHQRSVQ